MNEPQPIAEVVGDPDECPATLVPPPNPYYRPAYRVELSGGPAQLTLPRKVTAEDVEDLERLFSLIASTLRKRCS